MRPENLNYTAKLIRAKAHALARRIEFSDVDRSDIEHELLLDVLKRFPAFNPDRAKATTFIARIVEHGIASLLRDRRAAKRDIRRVVGSNCASNPILDELDDVTPRRRRGIPAHDPLRESDLRSDLEAAIAELPPKLQLLCAFLRGAIPIAEVARVTRRPRAALRNDVRRIRTYLEDAGLREYM